LIDAALVGAMLIAAIVGERAVGLEPATLGTRPVRDALDGVAIGLLLGGLALGAAPAVGLPASRTPALASTLLSPLAEERLFRSFLGRLLGPVPSAILFSIVHAAGPTRSVGLVAVGLLLWSAFHRRGLAAAYGLHVGMNAALLDLWTP
jgi:membrane protease YdiL (CAAX protease family)